MTNLPLLINQERAVIFVTVVGVTVAALAVTRLLFANDYSNHFEKRQAADFRRSIGKFASRVGKFAWLVHEYLKRFDNWLEWPRHGFYDHKETITTVIYSNESVAFLLHEIYYYRGFGEMRVECSWDCYYETIVNSDLKRVGST